MNSMPVRFYKGIISFAEKFQSYFLLIIRLYWGCAFVQTGWGKLNNIENVITFFQSLGIPFPEANAHIVGSIEFGCGLFLVLGFASRFACIPLIAVLIGAFATAHIEAVKNIFNDPDTFLSTSPFLFLYTTIVVFTAGPGKFSLDYLLEKKLKQ